MRTVECDHCGADISRDEDLSVVKIVVADSLPAGRQIRSSQDLMAAMMGQQVPKVKAEVFDMCPACASALMIALMHRKKQVRNGMATIKD